MPAHALDWLKDDFAKEYAFRFAPPDASRVKALRDHYGLASKTLTLQRELADTDLVLQAAAVIGDATQARKLLALRQRTLSRLCKLAPNCEACELPHADGAGGTGGKLLGGPASSTLDAAWLDDAHDVDEGAMSVRFCFADGNARDSVGDLLEIAGIDCSRHRINPVVGLDHFKNVPLPVALAEDGDGEYTVELDVIGKRAYCTAFFYRGEGEQGRLAAEVFDLVVKRVIRAGSLGFLALKALPLQADYERGIPAGQHLLRVLLLECSLVVMPANEDTVMKALDGKGLSPLLAKALRPHAPPRKAQLGYEARPACKCGRCLKCLRRRYGKKAVAGKPFDPQSRVYAEERRERAARHRRGVKGQGMPSYASVPKAPDELAMERSRPKPGPVGHGALGPRLPEHGAKAGWQEADHPRATDGRFGDKPATQPGDRRTYLRSRLLSGAATDAEMGELQQLNQGGQAAPPSARPASPHARAVLDALRELGGADRPVGVGHLGRRLGLSPAELAEAVTSLRREGLLTASAAEGSRSADTGPAEYQHQDPFAGEGTRVGYVALKAFTEADHPRASDGRFGSKPGSRPAGRSALQETDDAKRAALTALHAASRAYVSLKDTAKRFAAAGFHKLPTKAQTALARTYGVAKWAEHKAMTGFTKARELAEAVCRKRRLAEAGCAKLAKVLATADLISAWTVQGPAVLGLTGSLTATKVSTWVPLASLGYVAYSTARNPLATARAARQVVSGKAHAAAKGLNSHRDFAVAVADALAAADERADWFTALLSAALDQTKGDKGAALDLARQTFHANPNPPESASADLSESDADLSGPSAARSGPESKSLKDLRLLYGRKDIVRKQDRRGRPICYDSERGAFGRVPCHQVEPPTAATRPATSGVRPGNLPAPRGPGHAGTKYVARLSRFSTLAVRRRVLHGLKNEKELADAVGALNLPDSEPADVLLLADAKGELVTDPQTVKAHLGHREDAVRRLKRLPADSPEAKPLRELLETHTLIFFEVKTLVTQKGAGAIHMSAKAAARKQRWSERYAAPFWSIGFDDRRGQKFSGNRLYVKRGVGSARLADMTPVADFGELLGKVGEN